MPESVMAFGKIPPHFPLSKNAIYFHIRSANSFHMHIGKPPSSNLRHDHHDRMLITRTTVEIGRLHNIENYGI
jgi:hypothetical protein